jgi:hypothetical protein
MDRWPLWESGQAVQEDEHLTTAEGKGTSTGGWEQLSSKGVVTQCHGGHGGKLAAARACCTRHTLRHARTRMGTQANSSNGSARTRTRLCGEQAVAYRCAGGCSGGQRGRAQASARASVQMGWCAGVLMAA